MPRRKSDGRKKWSKARRSIPAHPSHPLPEAEQDQAVAVESTVVPVQHRLQEIPGMALKDLPGIIDEARSVENVLLQEDVVRECLRRILALTSPGSDRSPRIEQVRTLRRLIFGKGDVLLVARTGFGKSLIFHAFSVLTGLITLQIIPLIKLGDEQLGEIRKLDCTHPCLITSETKSRDKYLLKRVRRGEHTHVLLGPEQASSKAFRAVLRDPLFQRRVGLVAIDECHLVKQWSVFRAEFTMLGQLRTILHQDVFWFGCSATLDNAGEELVLDSAGFRCVGPRPYQTEVIRTSINRDDISIVVVPIPRGKVQSYDRLQFLLDESVNAESRTATPQRIQKTIIFIDGRIKVDQAATYLRQILLSKTSTFPEGQQYTQSGEARRCVFNVVETFTSHVSTFDRDCRYDEYKKPSSTIRLMVSTTSLGIGVNIPDIERVIIWRFPIDNSLCELWQRIGRGGRGEGRTSIAYILLPYWAFDSEGCDRPGPVPGQLAEAPVSPKVTYRKRNMLPSDRARVRSGLSASITPGDVSDAESQSSWCYDSDDFGQSEVLAVNSVPGRGYWSKAEASNRARLAEPWKLLCNARCKREPILKELGEQKLPDGAIAIRIPSDRCCNGCNPALSLRVAMPPEGPKPIAQPRAGTLASIALDYIDKWTTLRIEERYRDPRRRFLIPPSLFMGDQCRWQLAHLFTQRSFASCLSNMTLKELDEKAPLFKIWKWRQEYGQSMLLYLQDIVSEVTAVSLSNSQKRRDERAARSSATARAPSRIEHRGPISVSQYNGINRARDDSLAMQVAKHNALKAHQQLTLQTERASNQRQELDDASVPSTPTQSPRSTALADWVQERIRGSPGGTPSQSPPPEMPDSIRRAATVLEQIRRHTSHTPTQSTSRRISVEGEPSDSNLEGSDDRITSNVRSEGPVRRRREKTVSVTPSKRRAPLAEIESNVNKRLTFSPVSRSGRVRTATSKGSENFRIRREYDSS